MLTSVGLLPMSVAGINIDKVMKGLKDAEVNLYVDDINCNPVYKYAVIRNILYEKDKNMEIVINYEPKLFYLG